MTFFFSLKLRRTCMIWPVRAARCFDCCAGSSQGERPPKLWINLLYQHRSLSSPGGEWCIR